MLGALSLSLVTLFPAPPDATGQSSTSRIVEPGQTTQQSHVESETASASSVSPGFPASQAIDRDIFSYAASESHEEPQHREWIALDLGQVQYGISGVRVYPREGWHGFPGMFSLQLSKDGTTWETAPGGEWSGPRPDGWHAVVVDLRRPMAARHVRLLATELGRDGRGRYSLQLAELTVEQVDHRAPDRRAPAAEVVVSSAADRHQAGKLIDHGASTWWGSVPTDAADDEEWLTLRYAKRHAFTELELQARHGGLGFPHAFRLQHSADGETFRDIPGQAYTDYRPNTSGEVERFEFEVVRARALRVVVTRMRPHPGGGFAAQLAEASADVGSPFQTDAPGDFDRIWNDLWLQYGAIDDGQNTVIPFGNEPDYFEWIARKILWADLPGYRAGLKSRVREHPQNPEGYVWSWGDNPRWPSGNSLHLTTNPMYILAVWRLAVWDDPGFLDEVDSSSAAPVRSVVGYEATQTTPQVPPGGSLGQTFTVDEPWETVGGRFPTYGESTSDMTLTLYDEVGGSALASRRVTDVPDTSWQYLTFEDPQPAGSYYLEMTDPSGPITWWGSADDIEPRWQAFTNREPVAGDRSLRVQLSEQDPFNTDVSRGLTVWQKARRAMDYLETELDGADGLITIDNGENTGTVEGHPSNYWDNLNMGYLEPYTNVYFYAAVKAMGDLSRLRGDEGRASHYAALAKSVRQRFQETFWSEEAGRFVSTVDIDGHAWDFGLTFLNTEAIAYGLATPDQAEQILSWLDGQRMIDGDTSTGADIYHFAFAPRANTIPIESTGRPYWWNDVGGAVSLDGAAQWDQHLENGGTILYTAFFDIVARHRTRGIDDAFDRMQAIAAEYAVDELERRPTNSHGANWRLGTTGPFPESGLVPTAFVYTVLGVDATSAGLRLAPDLPTEMDRVQVRGLAFRGHTYDVTATRGDVELVSRDGGERRLAVEFAGHEPGHAYRVVITGGSAAARTTPTVETRTADRRGVVRVTTSLAGRGLLRVVRGTTSPGSRAMADDGGAS